MIGSFFLKVGSKSNPASSTSLRARTAAWGHVTIGGQRLYNPRQTVRLGSSFDGYLGDSLTLCSDVAAMAVRWSVIWNL